LSDEPGGSMLDDGAALGIIDDDGDPDAPGDGENVGAPEADGSSAPYNTKSHVSFFLMSIFGVENSKRRMFPVIFDRE